MHCEGRHDDDPTPDVLAALCGAARIKVPTSQGRDEPGCISNVVYAHATLSQRTEQEDDSVIVDMHVPGVWRRDSLRLQRRWCGTLGGVQVNSIHMQVPEVLPDSLHFAFQSTLNTKCCRIFAIPCEEKGLINLDHPCDLNHLPQLTDCHVPLIVGLQTGRVGEEKAAKGLQQKDG